MKHWIIILLIAVISGFSGFTIGKWVYDKVCPACPEERSAEENVEKNVKESEKKLNESEENLENTDGVDLLKEYEQQFSVPLYNRLEVKYEGITDIDVVLNKLRESETP